MLWTMTVILLVLWVMGLTVGSTAGYWVHLLLLFGLITLVMAVIRRGRVAY